MKSVFTTYSMQLFTMFTLCCIMIGCSQRNSHQDEMSNDIQDISIPSYVESTVKDSLGNVMHLSFHNETNELTAIFKNDTIQMSQEIMASGIKYANELYTFTEWHGEGFLYYKDSVIFSYK